MLLRASSPLEQSHDASTKETEKSQLFKKWKAASTGPPINPFPAGLPDGFFSNQKSPFG
jgi:hypothetical protein